MSKKNKEQEINQPEMNHQQDVENGSPEEINGQSEDTNNTIAELNDKYIRLYSEFDNYKRRTARERIELLQTASRELVVALLPVLDDFERAEKSFDSSQDLDALSEGVKLVNHKFRSILNQQGLTAMESIGKEFDVDYHEAITKIPAPSEDMKGKVVDELEKGYLLKEKVIRFAKVVVGE